MSEPWGENVCVVSCFDEMQSAADEPAPSRSVVTSDPSVLRSPTEPGLKSTTGRRLSEAPHVEKKGNILIDCLLDAKPFQARARPKSMYWHSRSFPPRVLSEQKCKCITEPHACIIQWPSARATRLKDENNELVGWAVKEIKPHWIPPPPLHSQKKHIKNKLQSCHGSSWKHIAFPIAIGPWIPKLWSATNYIL